MKGFHPTISILLILSCLLPFSCAANKTIPTSQSEDYKFSPNKKIDSLLIFATEYLEVPYKKGGKGPNYFDCSGFTYFVFNEFGQKLNRRAASQINNGEEVSERIPQPGDLVFFKGRDAKRNRIKHVGIVLSINEDNTFNFIHAAVKSGVTINRSDHSYYKKRFITACRVILPYEEKAKKEAKKKKEKEMSSKSKHKVEKGDTLYSIAKKYYTSVDKIKELNKLKTNNIKVGQKLKIK